MTGEVETEIGIRQRKNADSAKLPELKEGRKQAPGNEILYTVDQSPPWYSCIFLGLQHLLLLIGGPISLPLLATSFMCIEDDDVGKSEVICTSMFVCGIATLLQTTFGTRIPIVQGPSAAFIAPLIAMFSLPKWACPDVPVIFQNTTSNDSLFMDMTYMEWRRGVWTLRMREFQGAISLAAIFQVVIGFTGLIGFLLRFIGPLTIAPTICLVGLSLYGPTTNFCSKQWGIAALTVILIILFSQYLHNVLIPIPKYSRNLGWSKTRIRLFQMFPVFLAVVIAWLLCAILTVTNALPNDKTSPNYGARTDKNLYVLEKASWIRLPYPGQWGLPTVSVAPIFGMLAGIIAGFLESVGDYFACARISEAPPPPPHVINRGVFAEGVLIIVDGMCGTGTGLTSFSQNIGAIGITKVASRRVVQVCGLLLIFAGLVGKVGAFFVTIPEPIIGGMFLVLFGMITAVGVANLQFVDLNSSRNMFVFGFSLFLGFSIPTWLEGNPRAIVTGEPIVDQIFTILLSTHMFVGGITAFILDNTVPGTIEERGIQKWLVSGQGDTQDKMDKIYGFPFGMSCLRRSAWAKYVPLCPSYEPSCLKIKTSPEEDKQNEHVDLGIDNKANDNKETSIDVFSTRI